MSATDRNIPDAELTQDEPVTQVLLQGLRDTAWASGFGRHKVWTNPTRAHSTTYQNTTDAAMAVHIRGNTGAPSPVQVATESDFSDAIEVGYFGIGGGEQWCSFLVPINHYYRVNGSTVISEWSELVDG